MEKNYQSSQYQDCTLENMLALLSELFGPNVSQESNLLNICSEDVNNLDIIKDGVEKRFGVCITSTDIVKSANVAEFTDNVVKLLESPRFPVSEKELRKEQLSKIANDKTLQPLIGQLKSAADRLEESIEEINNIQAPIDSIEGILGVVKKRSFEQVVVELDKNTHAVARTLGEAIECTNTWIDEICKMLIWIIQIENDIYGIAEESSSETLRLSRLLSQEGANVDNLAEVAAMEQSKRRRVQQKIKKFKSDIEGKIEFLNEVHKTLLSQFEEHKKDIQNEFESANNELEQKVGNYFLDLNNKFSNLLNETKDNFQQLQKVLKDEEENRKNEFDRMKSEQIGFFKEVKSDISKVDEKTTLFKKEQSIIIEKLQKQNNIYKVISFSAIVVSVAALLFALLK